ncbi:hypothetical protein [Xanthomonas arboricola]|uniref:hypothetical protein n=1 Tax=Xanthomonas arboricola TaxID=56448 RepID=UPI0013A5D4EF|nr:hypothetical protein [Xanthomonas arboricola]
MTTRRINGLGAANRRKRASGTTDPADAIKTGNNARHSSAIASDRIRPEAEQVLRSRAIEQAVAC